MPLPGPEQPQQRHVHVGMYAAAACWRECYAIPGTH